MERHTRHLNWIAILFICCFAVLAPAALSEVEESASKPECPKGMRTLEDCLKSGDVTMELYGDGLNTSHCELELTNKKTGEKTTTTIPTVCVSHKTKKPPPDRETAQKENIHYKLGGPAPRAVANTLAAAKSLAKAGKYDSVPLPKGKAEQTVTQLSIWKTVGKGSKNPLDNVTPETIKNDLLKKANVDESTLSKEDKDEVKKRVDSIFDAVDLTCKESQTIADKPKPPKDDVIFEGTVTEEPKIPGEHSCVPETQIFECNNPDYQQMMCTNDTHFACPGQSATLAPAGGTSGQVLPNQQILPPNQQILPPTGTLNPLKGFSPTGQCCINYVSFLNETNQTVTYELVHEGGPGNVPPRIQLAFSDYVKPGASTTLGPIHEHEIDIESFVPDPATGLVFHLNLYHYACQGTGAAQISTNLPGLANFNVFSVPCSVAGAPGAPAPSAPTLPPTMGTPPPTTPTTPGTATTPTTPTTPTTAPRVPTTGTGTTPKGSTAPATATPPPIIVVPGTTAGAIPVPIMMPPISAPTKGPGKKPAETDKKGCTIKAITLTNDWTEPVVYQIYATPDDGGARKIVKASGAVKPGQSTTLKDDFGQSVRVMSVKPSEAQGGRPLAIQEFNCDEPGIQDVVTDYSTFRHVTVQSSAH